MTIKVVTQGVGADGSGRATDVIVARLRAMRNRSQYLLSRMKDLEDQFRRHSAASRTLPPSIPIPPDL
jgi:hypothetical protein